MKATKDDCIDLSVPVNSNQSVRTARFCGGRERNRTKITHVCTFLRIQELPHFVTGDSRGIVLRVAIDPRRDSRESDTLDPFFLAKFQSRPVTTPQEFLTFLLSLAVIDRSDRVSDVFRGERVTRRELCLSRLATVEFRTFGFESRSRF